MRRPGVPAMTPITNDSTMATGIVARNGHSWLSARIAVV